MAYRRQLGNNVGTAENSSDEDSFTVEEQVDEEIPSNGKEEVTAENSSDDVSRNNYWLKDLTKRIFQTVQGMCRWIYVGLEHMIIKFHILFWTKSVTNILRDLKLPYVGKAGMFSPVAASKNVGEGLRDEDGITNSIELGKLLEYFIEQFLQDNHGFEIMFQPQNAYYHLVPDEMFGEAAWGLIEPMITTEPTAKLLEQPLVGYGAKGRADCIIQREGQPAIIIDFKWTAVNYQNPSPGYALQLLLYQWMEGQQYGEEEGAELYLIRFCEDINTMQLIPFIPEEGIRYSSANASKVKSYKDICDAFCEAYGYRGPKSVNELSTKMYEKLTLK